ncbi:DPBB and LysM peptidoglycan-binding domain-containing protein [Companilactobacillus keshanensis]|uniref:LysM peptidoglycan-binding domain-containing protein n=1 Tax=Companilactobacillus keshanensis TaxID=2486003 RepID=A0ABW4BTX4_9LACO|nr:LysM peptidoglycan-binding domain-containing protein [Companilactobacillus keshanensis]
MKKVLSIALLSTMALTAMGATAKTAQAATTIDSTHVSVEAGDTYKSIAAANGITIAELEQANGREVGGFDLIFPGETITLPTAQATTDTTQAQTQTQTATQATTDTTQPAVQTQATTATQTQTQTTQSSTTGTSQGTFKISFYDPAVLGSNMGYSGVAANLSVFPKGTQLKITLADGTVLYRTVNDTGTFAYSNPQQLDVAMPNAQIPSYGVTSATVEVI